MVQRKIPSKVFVQLDNVEFDKHLAPSQLSSQHQDDEGSGADMSKSRSIQLSGLEAFQSPPSKRSFSKPKKPSPFHLPTAATSPQKQQPLMRTGRSLHYMKHTISSGAKKELLPASLQSTQSDSDNKNQRPKFSSNWKTSLVPGKQPAKTSTRPSRLKLVSTLTQNPSFKSSSACPRKSSKIALCADMDAHRTSCSTLKNSISPAYLMLNPGVTKSERTSVVKVCPYTFCSLNDQRHTPLPPLKSFLLERRSIFKSQKTRKQEALRLQRLKLPLKTKDSDIEQTIIDGKSACDDAEIGFFIEIYAKVEEHEAKPTAAGDGHEMRKLESSEELQDQEVNKYIIEDNSLAARKENIKQVTTSMLDESPYLESNRQEDFQKYSDDTVTEADTTPRIHQKQNAESANENHPPNYSHDDRSMESCCSEILGRSEMDVCDFEVTDTEWKEKKFCTSKLEEKVVSAVLIEEETEFKVESLSESSLEASVRSDDILSCYKDIIVTEAPQEANAQENGCFEAQPYGTVATFESKETQETGHRINGVSCDQCSSLIEQVFQDLTNAENNDGKNETSLDNDVNCATDVLNDVQEHISLKDGTTMSLNDQIYEASKEGCKLNQVERARDKGSRRLEMENTEIYQDFAKQVESNGYGSQGHKISEPNKINENHEDRESSLETDNRSISQVKEIQLKDGHSENICAAQDKEMLEGIEIEANKFKGTSCTGSENQKTSKNWRGELKQKIPMKDDEQLRQLNARKPNFLPLIPNPEREKVMLKHQKMDERRSAEQWMLDHALRQAVTKLASVRKSKVALLVEALETVMPVAKGKSRRKVLPLPMKELSKLET